MAAISQQLASNIAQMSFNGSKIFCSLSKSMLVIFMEIVRVFSVLQVVNNLVILELSTTIRTTIRTTA